MCRNIDGVVYPVQGMMLAEIGILLASFLRVGTADIVDLSVSTLKIQDNAVNLMVAAFTAGELYYADYSWHLVQTITLETSGAPVMLIAAVQWRNNGDNGLDMLLQRDGSVTVYSTNMDTIGQFGNPFCVALTDEPSAAEHTYDLYIKTTNVAIGSEWVRFKNRSLVGKEVKK
jgi:hypothetical protein